eukprot:GHVU01137928.1.p1 GENE.GHVU01137928.1~~GHVU01137928.1.p1  ORF type:complete len:210 (+),score=30.76 GHVU01137928.1:381-1010(+)
MYGGRFLNGVSLRRCDNTAGVTITVVSQINPHVWTTFTVQPVEELRQFNDATLLKFVKQQIERALDVKSQTDELRNQDKRINDILLGEAYNQSERLEENHLHVYMRNAEEQWRLFPFYQDSLPKPGFLPTSIIVIGPMGTWPVPRTDGPPQIQVEHNGYPLLHKILTAAPIRKMDSKALLEELKKNDPGTSTPASQGDWEEGSKDGKEE